MAVGVLTIHHETSIEMFALQFIFCRKYLGNVSLATSLTVYTIIAKLLFYSLYR